MTPETAQERLNSGDPFAFMCMSEQSYLTLGSYFQDVLRYAKQCNSILDYYGENE